MNAVLAIPLEVRLALLAGLGCGLGALVNLAVDRFAWQPRWDSPWSPPPPGAPPRRRRDRWPIVGHLLARGRLKRLGPGAWLRPLSVELAMAVLLPALYWWEIGQLGLLPALGAPPTADLLFALHMQYISHVLLVTLMFVASRIDIDEKIIPDAVTVPGTLLGLALAALYPWSLLPESIWPTRQGAPQLHFLHIASPNPWPANLQAAPHREALALALGCWWMWCVALMPRRWYGRRGPLRAVQLLFARLGREAVTKRLLALGALGTMAIAWLWWGADETRWAGLLTALVGLAAGGGIIWAVRIIGTLALRREAMGFGDVTLMAMIGAFVGWQASLMVFFLAPFAGLVVGLIQWLLHRDNEIPYGPFLCLASLGVIVAWEPCWSWAKDVFAAGWLVPTVMAACMVLLGVLLVLWRGLLLLVTKAWHRRG